MSLEIITSTSPLLKNVRVSDIWRQMVSFNKIGSSIPQIIKVKQYGRYHSEWHLALETIPFSWNQKDCRDAKNYTCTFTQLEGDFESLSGCWKIIRNVNNHLKIHFQIGYSIGLPAVEDSRSNICKVLFQNFADSLVQWHYQKFSDYNKNTREMLRYPVNSKKEITIGSRPAEVIVLDISRSGIKFYIKNSSLEIPSTAEADITVGKVRIFGNFFPEPFYSTCRMKFKNELSDEQMCSILSLWNLYPNRDLLTVYDVLTAESAFCPQDDQKTGSTVRKPVKAL
ncbi:MAG TPA: SRPBCC family protein [Chitinispirillaceae bacterium]|nr:SRPBCC family protein [Chitinispirillaceae bacterium]